MLADFRTRYQNC